MRMPSLNVKQIVGIAVVGLGILSIAYGIYTKKHVSHARSEIHRMRQSQNPIMKSAGKHIENKIGSYSTRVKLSIFGGIVLILIGGGAVYNFRRD